ncbi:MAG: DUF5335 family protein [Thermoanaerobaculia bacterium]|nr:DUF5335 family protein [Thermoanaerobaculia bacterium]
MSERVIPRQSWSEFLSAFSGQHYGWLVTIEIREGDGAMHTVADERPLKKIAFEGNDDIEIVVGDTGTIHERIAGATELRVHESAPEAIESLTIDSPIWQTTIRFRTAIPPVLVDGVIGYEK